MFYYNNLHTNLSATKMVLTSIYLHLKQENDLNRDGNPNSTNFLDPERIFTTFRNKTKLILQYLSCLF